MATPSRGKSILSKAVVVAILSQVVVEWKNLKVFANEIPGRNRDDPVQ